MRTSIPDALTQRRKMEVPSSRTIDLLAYAVCVPLTHEDTLYLYEDDLWGGDASQARKFTTFLSASNECLRFQEKAVSESRLKPFYANATVAINPGGAL